MSKNLVIVESPAKAKTIEGFLGKDYTVTSSYGHIRDLDKKNNGIDIENKFEPTYIVPEDKKHVVQDLKKKVKKSEIIWLATDEDREGEAISWHLKEVLALDDDKVKRIIFNEITKKAILDSIKNSRKIDKNLVDAQQARRILDRLVGFKLSPVLWRKVKPQLSAGRVQSVAVRLIVERERQIDKFKSESQYRVVGQFMISGLGENAGPFKAELSKKFDSHEEAEKFLEKCSKAEFTVESLEKKDATKTPAAPFTTSTLQQEASRKLGYSVARTMLIAQKLYESGKITYMRTDSVNLSEFALESSQKIIEENYGSNYSNRKQYKTTSASAQEAHEAIRPTYYENATVDGGRDEKVLYELIWKRAVASQMSDAQLERTTAKINISNSEERFIAKGEVIKFDGFLKVYLESTDEENGNGNGNDSGLLPVLEKGQHLAFKDITATQRFSRPPARYTEASLVKKLEELGIGRPSTYAPTISTIQKRGYIVKEERQGREREYDVLMLGEDGKITSEKKTEVTGAEKNKLYPEDIAMLVNDFLLDHFPRIMDYKFTAHIEEELDDIAKGKMDWHEMLDEFYFPFNEKVEHTLEKSERVSGERILGTDPKTGKQVSVRMARFGPVAQLTDLNDEEAKPEYAGLLNDQKLETITLKQALDLFKLPRTVGVYEYEEVVAAIGRFGPYVRHNGKFYSLGKLYDPHKVTLEESIEVIESKRKKDAEKTIKIFEEDPTFQILNGRWGPYLKADKLNVRIPKDMKAEDLTYEQCKELAGKSAEKKKGKKK